MVARGRRRKSANTASSLFRWGPIPEAGQQVKAESVVNAEDRGRKRKKKRKSRWEPIEESNDAASTGGQANGKEIMLFPGEIVLSNGIKVVLPPALTGRHVSGDPEIVRMHQELAEIDRKIRQGVEDTRPEHERSPSPPPIYDSQGVRLNTREVRMKEKLTRKRNEMIEELLKRDETFKPPADYRPEKKSRKIFIPYKEYPDANFIGLIIGPRGNTQKRMQEETNTRIAIRGKGSVKDGASRAQKYSSQDDEELHVLITGDRQEDVDKAAEMIEKLLVPVDEELNEHKKAQLRELALINGTLKEDTGCHLCGDPGHRQIDCPQKQLDVYRLPDAIQEKVEEQYARDLARMNPGEALKNDEEYKSFMESLGGTDPRAQTTGANRVGLGYNNKNHGPDTLKVWIGNLSPSVDDATLKAMFEPFGTVTLAQVKQDSSGGDRCFGFVHFTEESMAAKAVEAMNGKMVHDRQIAVRQKGVFEKRRRQPEDDHPPDCKLFVSGIPPHIDGVTLQREFERCGQVLSAKVVYDRETHASKGFGFVVMGDPRQAMAAIANMNGFLGFDPMGRPLVVRLADNRDRSSSGRAAFGREPQGGYHAVPPQQPVYGGYGQPGYPVSGYAPQQTYMVDQYQYGQYYEQPPPLPEEELPPPPPMPEEEPPPLPEEEPPPPPPPEEGGPNESNVQSEYEKFMAEMGGN
ncbi:Splicing factor-like protein 1 [Picochlorum sp. SENEW3]|nr:Splicing factor-like protein 1 [Picochlorum sp. SENEW3]